MRSPQTRSGFTLIELLTVIAIIAILMGLLFPAMTAVQNNANKTRAMNDAKQIVAAVKQYYSDYGQYPMTDTQAKANADTVFGDDSGSYNNSLLFNILRDIPKDPNDKPQAYGKNPPRVVYIEAPNVKDNTSPRNGINSEGKWFDPWGKEYIVWIDANYDNELDVMSTNGGYADLGTGTSKPRTGVGAASAGKDRKLGNAGDKKFPGSDDVITWQ